MRSLASTAVAVLCAAVAATSFPASAQAMTVKPIRVPKSPDGVRVKLVPKYVRAAGEQVTSASLTVKRGKRVVGRGASVRVKPGTYTVQQSIKYRVAIGRHVQMVWNDFSDGSGWVDLTPGKQECQVTSVESQTQSPYYQVDYTCNLPKLSLTPLAAHDIYTVGSEPVPQRGDWLSGTGDHAWLFLDAQKVGRWALTYGRVKTKVGKRQKITVRAFNRACVNNRELNRFKSGWSKSRVHTLFGTKGWQESFQNVYGTRLETRVYYYCDVPYDDYGYPEYTDHFWVYYRNDRVTGWYTP